MDKLIQRKVDDARRILIDALRLCDEVARKEPLLARSSRSTRDDLTRTLYSMDRVRRIQSIIEEEKPVLKERKPKVQDTPLVPEAESE